MACSARPGSSVGRGQRTSHDTYCFYFCCFCCCCCCQFEHITTVRLHTAPRSELTLQNRSASSPSPPAAPPDPSPMPIAWPPVIVYDKNAMRQPWKPAGPDREKRVCLGGHTIWMHPNICGFGLFPNPFIMFALPAPAPF